MSKIQVFTPALAAAALQIEAAADSADQAFNAVWSASDVSGQYARGSGSAGLNAGFPLTGPDVADAFSNTCRIASEVMNDMDTALRQLGRNVSSAAQGYVETDKGVIPVSDLHQADSPSFTL